MNADEWCDQNDRYLALAKAEARIKVLEHALREIVRNTGEMDGDDWNPHPLHLGQIAKAALGGDKP